LSLHAVCQLTWPRLDLPPNLVAQALPRLDTSSHYTDLTV
jgi:hypothetical protein